MLLLIILNVITILHDYNYSKQNFNSSEFTAVFMRGKNGMFFLLLSSKLEKHSESTALH